MDLTNYVPTALSTVKASFEAARRDSTTLVQAALETIEKITNGEAVLMDASCPAVMLLEMAAVMSANCIQESNVCLRKQYPVLATNTSELYRHMSDEDYLNRFAKPASGKFIMGLQLAALKAATVYDETEDLYKAIIPRDTTITVDGICFTLLYPIVFRVANTGALQISYDAEITNPLYSLTNTIIEPTIRQTTGLEQWVFFNFTALQVKINTEYYVLDKTYNFQKTILFEDQFYYARAFYKTSDSSTAWVEVQTTHTDQVFDPLTATVVFQVVNDTLIVKVPIIYLTSGKMAGELRIDVYTTKGEMSLALKNYAKESFVAKLMAIDEVRDLNDYTAAMADVSYYVYSTDIVTGGSSEVSFATLRDRVIYNSVGPQVLPITNVQLAAEADNDGFAIVNNVDVLTNRVFLATRKLPVPSNTKLITPANIGIVTYAATLEKLALNDYVIDNGDRLTILSKSLWLSENGVLKLLTKADIDALYAMTQTSMLAQINAAQYFYTPFHYVLDASGDEFEIRSYSLDQPYGYGLNFVRQNQTLQLYVNTANYSLKKTATGYALRITTTSGNYYQAALDSQVGVQLAFYPYGETTLAYINGIQESKNSANERTFRFDLISNHDLNSDDLFCITNSTVEGITNYKAWISLDTVFNMLHYTTSLSSGYLPDETDALLGKFMLPATAVGNSHEKLALHLGDALSNLWRRSRSYLTDRVYRLHTENVPKTYDNDVFATDSATGSILNIDSVGKVTYTVAHKAGDTVLDVDGNVVYKYKVGDVMRDENGSPVYDVNSVTGREMDLLVVDGRYYFANDTASVSYRDEIESTLIDWITDRISTLQEKLLEQTRIFFYPKTTLGTIHVKIENSGEDYLPAEQSFKLALYVNYTTFNDEAIRESLRVKSVTLLDKYLSASTVNMSEISDQLRVLYGSAVPAFSISGLGGDKNYQLVSVASERTKLCLKKLLVAQADKTLIVEDAVTVEFKLAS